MRAWCPRGEEQRWGGGGVGLQRWYYYFYFYPRGGIGVLHCELADLTWYCFLTVTGIGLRCVSSPV